MERWGLSGHDPSGLALIVCHTEGRGFESHHLLSETRSETTLKGAGVTY
jgi:hypothetical protein